jgi:hypothetical protein
LRRKDSGFSTITEVEIDGLAKQIKQQEADAKTSGFEPEKVVFALRNDAGDKLPIGFFKTSDKSGQIVEMAPGAGVKKGNYSNDAQRLRMMYEQYSGYFSFNHSILGVQKIPVESLTIHQKQAIDGVGRLILGMEYNMGMPIGSFPSVVNPGTFLKPADTAPEDREKVEQNQKDRKNDDIDDARNRLTPTKKR